MPRNVPHVRRRRQTKTRAAFNRILVATDFSPDAARALEVARALADALGAELVLLHVDEPLTEIVRSNEDLAHRRAVDASLHRATERLRAQGVPARYSLLAGKPADRIVDAAAAEAAALIVLGTRGRSTLVGAVLGSVAYQVARHAPCPVVMVRRSGSPQGPAPQRRRPARAPRSTR